MLSGLGSIASTFRNQEHDLTFRRMGLVMRKQFTRGAATKFFEFFGELARDAELSIWQDVDAGPERFREAVRRLEKYACLVTRSGAA